MSVELQILYACHMSSSWKIKERQQICHICFFKTNHFFTATIFKVYYSLQCTWEWGLSGSPTHIFEKKTQPTHSQCSAALPNPYQILGRRHGKGKCQTIPEESLIINSVSHTAVAGECLIMCHAQQHDSIHFNNVQFCDDVFLGTLSAVSPKRN